MSDDKKNHAPKIEVNELDDKKKKSMGNRIIVAAILICLALPCVVLGGWFWFAFVTVFLGFAIYEVLKAPQKKYKWYIWVFTYIAIYSFALWGVVKANVSSYIETRKTYETAIASGGTLNFAWSPSLESHYSSLWISLYGIATCFGFYSLCSILHEEFTWHDVTYFFTMCFVIGIGFQAMLFCRFVPFNSFLSESGISTDTAIFKYWQSAIFFIFVILTTCLNDTWAYFVGMLFGKHHMSPRISPNKTWEGFVGGCVLSAISGFAFLMICEGCGFVAIPTMNIFGPNTKFWWPLILCFTMPLIGDLGDFTFSAIKRHYGFKDYSHILGAHGGILDRADSLIFTMIYSSIFVVFTANSWSFLK